MKIEDLRQVIKKNKFIFFNYKKFTSVNYKNGYKAYLKKCSKSKSEVKRELNLLKNYWECDPMHYFRYHLFDKDLSDDELLNYIPPYYFYNVYMKNILKGVDNLLFDSKLFLNKLFLARAIKTPTFIAEIKKKYIFNSKGKPISFQNLIEDLNTSTASKFFLKPDRGSGGNGILVIEKIEDQMFINKKPLALHSFSKEINNNDYILQEGIVQREDISRINSSSVNTLRVITQFDGVHFKMPIAVMRIGKCNSHVDNATQGGISVNINVVNGELNEFAFLEHGTEVYDKHPDSNFVFKGFKIQNWNGIKEKIELYTRKIAELKEIAWDIAITENDIYVIEINTSYGIDHLQCTAGGMRKKLHIDLEKSV